MVRGKQEEPPAPECSFCAFGLIVTGKGERDFLPDFMRSLAARAPCNFKVIRRIGQRNPVTSEKRIIKMVGCGKTIPTQDEMEIAIPTRRFLHDQPCSFVVLVDDAEADRRPILDQVFARYRGALDLLLTPTERGRVAVHFLANMLEAYYFAHSDAVNLAVAAEVLAGDHPTDVEETIPHPKNRLKTLYPGFDERVHGAEIVARLDIDRVLGQANMCAYLRALFGWCVRQLVAHCQFCQPELSTCYELLSGLQAEVTRYQ
jgi:hypothetical protein